MHPVRLGLLLLCLLSVTPSHAASRREKADELAARQAHALLDQRSWAQVVRIDNADASRRLPRQTWATVFELGGRLWIYLPRTGTRSLSYYAGHLRRDKTDLTAVLGRVHEGFHAYRTIVTDNTAAVPEAMEPAAGSLPEGCFVESLAKLWSLQAEGETVIDADLVLYYGGYTARGWGHTVLCYQTPEGWFSWDSLRPSRINRLDGDPPEDVLTLARSLASPRVASRVSDARRLDMVLPDGPRLAAQRKSAPPRSNDG
ncbi:hypothetical protein [Synoicihabitans lomoniglobus]|uniref:Uncharacterized protein n=1 Tax=Synoicihabitans lomoniglobus TaxID=2909285 RepID=A0AAF0CNT6_9BACT|nr:hypothetical protein [Opitutaceae bacterium LMO-M01]WED65016.1 hypothetical protein PXH66_21925 [Opitutaceae bacterium LMO-M01]